VRNFFTRHRARRPTIEQERFDLVVCFSNFAAFDHSNVVSHSRALSSCFALRRIAIIRRAKQDALRSFSEGGPPVYYVYLIESVSAQDERYLGMTSDLKQRLQEHNAGK